ncbi:hypothetical protein JCM33374_g3204 [Metschnikowia sp. JCM 33374]|nr:hypothetical protein JCM33374_g3204 [Metschnikowia sp. JCM 33374]
MSYNNRTRYNRKSFRPSQQRRSFGGRSSTYAPHYQRQYPQSGAYLNGGERRRYYDARPAQPTYESYRHNNSSRNGRKYAKYNYPQPSGEVFIEEPETESEDGDSESEYDGLAHSDDDERTYDFDLQSNDEEDYESDIYYDSDGLPEGDYEEVFVIPEDFDGVDVNDDLENDAIDALEAEGEVRDVNDDLLRYYDSDSDLDISSSEEYDSEIDEGLLLLDSSDSDSDSESSSSDSDSDSDSDAASYTDLELDSEEELEDLRQALAQVAESADEVSDSESDSDDEDIFIEVDSDFYNSEDDDDFVVDNEYDESSDSSDDEGLTIYKHRFDLPDRYDSDNDSTDPELEMYDDEFLLRANDSDDEYEVIDMTKDLEGSKDCELVELDDTTYKLNLRFPSLAKEDLKINFLKNENELVINGKFNFNIDDSDNEEDVEEKKDDEEKEVEAESSDSDFDANAPESESESDSSSSESEKEDETKVAEELEEIDSDYDANAPSSESESESSEYESESEAQSTDSESDSDEEIMEDAQEMIKDFQNHEIQFEKRFVFDKIVKFDEIKASFLENGELELIIPNEGVEVDSAKNNVAISIEGQPQQKTIEAETAEVQAVAEAVAEAATADIEMAT